jgi:hypothetical protein
VRSNQERDPTYPVNVCSRASVCIAMVTRAERK